MTSQNSVPKSKAAVVSLLFKADVANPNAGWTEENVTAMKKIETPDRQRYPYISGQALRRYLRDTLRQLLPEGQIQIGEPGATDRSPIVTAGRPDQYFDDDIFGFLRAAQQRTSRRESPLKVSAAIGQYPFVGDLDLGTRSAVEVFQDAERGGAIFETEVTSNVYSTTMMLELDRVGRWRKWEHVDGTEGELADNERKERAANLVRAFKYLNGHARAARLLISLLPQVFFYVRLTKKIPLLLGTLETAYNNGTHHLRLDTLLETLSDYREDVQFMAAGVRTGFGNISSDELRQHLTKALGNSERLFLASVGEAIEKAVTDVRGADF